MSGLALCLLTVTYIAPQPIDKACPVPSAQSGQPTIATLKDFLEETNDTIIKYNQSLEPDSIYKKIKAKLISNGTIPRKSALLWDFKFFEDHLRSILNAKKKLLNEARLLNTTAHPQIVNNRHLLTFWCRLFGHFQNLSALHKDKSNVTIYVPEMASETSTVMAREFKILDLIKRFVDCLINRTQNTTGIKLKKRTLKKLEKCNSLIRKCRCKPAAKKRSNREVQNKKGNEDKDDSEIKTLKKKGKGRKKKKKGKKGKRGKGRKNRKKRKQRKKGKKTDKRRGDKSEDRGKGRNKGKKRKCHICHVKSFK